MGTGSQRAFLMGQLYIAEKDTQVSLQGQFNAANLSKSLQWARLSAGYQETMARTPPASPSRRQQALMEERACRTQAKSRAVWL